VRSGRPTTIGSSTSSGCATRTGSARSTRLLLDTSVLIAPPVEGDDRDPIAISAISVGELHAGVELARDARTRSARLARLAALVSSVPVLPVDGSVAARYGELRRESGRVPSNDLWIAATALAHDLTLVTRDDRLATVPLVRVRHVR
jgi:predicted nucleic acid-binding protein